jgi:hypothetical protein
LLVLPLNFPLRLFLAFLFLSFLAYFLAFLAAGFCFELRFCSSPIGLMAFADGPS